MTRTEKNAIREYLGHGTGAYKIRIYRDGRVVSRGARSEYERRCGGNFEGWADDLLAYALAQK